MILASTGSGNFTMIIILVAMIALMYFMMIRPQNKERKRLQEMLGSMDIGDAVLTSSGFYGVVIEIAGDDVIVEFGNNKNCRIPMKKSAIVQVEKPGGYTAPVEEKKAKKAVEEKKEEVAQEVKETAQAAENAAKEVKEAAEEVVSEAAEAADKAE